MSKIVAKLIGLLGIVELIGFILVVFTFFFTKDEFTMIKMGILTIILMLTVSKSEEN